MINTETENPENYRRPPIDPNNRKRYQFTPDELRVLKECNKESFYQRCIPISTILGGVAYYAVKTGYLRGNPRFGATPKVIVGAIVGYFIGKFSYQSKCAEKLMQLPHSQIGEMLRQKRRGKVSETADSGFGPGFSLAPFSGVSSADTYSDVNPFSSLDLDTTRPETPGLDDHFRPSMDNQTLEMYEEMPPEQKRTTTYEELRKKNREEYAQQRTSSFRDPFNKLSAEAKFDRDYNAPQENKYGDKFE
ncbi:OCIA domain-containing protein 1-like [Diorhabda carinulata]|uniref:OCIA domain-containing protein 1-like n=1 Tax=Diorhabda carinulata TaxID=1163345 RepID=UPI0025A04946|nr:OCIA domain-containing protein 1-like [Diorhabda carinulata]